MKRTRSDEGDAIDGDGALHSWATFERAGDEKRALGDEPGAYAAYGASVKSCVDVPSRVFLKLALAWRRASRLSADSGEREAYERTLKAGLRRATREADDDVDDGIVDIEKRASVVGRDRRVRAIGGQLALLYCQDGREAEAAQTLTFLGYEYRLGQRVLRYDLEHAAATSERIPRGVMHAYDGCLSPAMLASLRRAFAKNAAFWREHDYANPKTGFFSYVHELDGAPISSPVMRRTVELAREIAAREFSAVRDAKYAEWWAHCRPACDGHQCHFDSHNEGLGVVTHPICSVIIYIDGSCGGPTLMTNQRAGDRALATKCYLMPPRDNRVAVFDGTFLHGVVPGRINEDPALRRVTLMVAFWPEMDVVRASFPPGSARAFPERAMEYPGGISWPNDFYDNVDEDDDVKHRDIGTVEVDIFAQAHAPWEKIRVPRDAASDEDDEDDESMPAYDACFQGF